MSKTNQSCVQTRPNNKAVYTHPEVYFVLIVWEFSLPYKQIRSVMCCPRTTKKLTMDLTHPLSLWLLSRLSTSIKPHSWPPAETHHYHTRQYQSCLYGQMTDAMPIRIVHLSLIVHRVSQIDLTNLGIRILSTYLGIRMLLTNGKDYSMFRLCLIHCR